MSIGHTAEEVVRQADGHLKQIKVTVDVGLAQAFKAACAASSTSMASALSQFMSEFASAEVAKKPVSDYSTKRQRRAALRAILKQLEQIREYEEVYRDRIPLNLQNSERYENAEEFIGLIEEATSLLSMVP